MGIQGTPLVKIGGDKAAIELERRRTLDDVIVTTAKESSPATSACASAATPST
jgi:hypothetical protein